MPKYIVAGAAWTRIAEVMQQVQTEDDAERAGTIITEVPSPKAQPNGGQHTYCPNSAPELGMTNGKLMEPCLPNGNAINDVDPEHIPPTWPPE